MILEKIWVHFWAIKWVTDGRTDRQIERHRQTLVRIIRRMDWQTDNFCKNNSGRKQTDRQTYVQTDKLINRKLYTDKQQRTYSHTYKQTDILDKHTDNQTHRQLYRQTNRQTNTETDGQTDKHRQTNIHTYRQTDKLIDRQNYIHTNNREHTVKLADRNIQTNRHTDKLSVIFSVFPIMVLPSANTALYFACDKRFFG